MIIAVQYVDYGSEEPKKLADSIASAISKTIRPNLVTASEYQDDKGFVVQSGVTVFVNLKTGRPGTDQSPGNPYRSLRNIKNAADRLMSTFRAAKIVAREIEDSNGVIGTTDILVRVGPSPIELSPQLTPPP